MDEIQRILIKAGRKDLAQQYYEKIAAKKTDKVTDNDWLDFLTYALTTKIKEKDLKYLTYKKKGKNIVFRDIEGELGHIEIGVTNKNIDRWRIPNPLKDKNIDDLISFLKKKRVKEYKQEKRKKGPGRSFSVYD